MIYRSEVRQLFRFKKWCRMNMYLRRSVRNTAENGQNVPECLTQICQRLLRPGGPRCEVRLRLPWHGAGHVERAHAGARRQVSLFCCATDLQTQIRLSFEMSSASIFRILCIVDKCSLLRTSIVRSTHVLRSTRKFSRVGEVLDRSRGRRSGGRAARRIESRRRGGEGRVQST